MSHNFAGPRRPNIILITCDQLRMDALGCYGNPIIKTPNIDRLAQNGIRFDQGFVACPVCSPNRGSLATGRYPSVHGLRFNGAKLPETEITLMDELRKNGYFTCGAGKMHFEPQWRTRQRNTPDPSPNDANNPQPKTFPWYGFDRILVSEDHRVGPYADYLAEHGLDTWADLHSFSYPQSACSCSIYPPEHHQTNWIADRSIEMILSRDPEKPLFLWTSFVDPHHPFNPPAPYDKMYNPADMPLPKFSESEPEKWPTKYLKKYNATSGSHEAIGMNTLSNEEWQKIIAYYYGMISCIDDAIGRMLDIIDQELGLENTIILLTSDHGEMLGDHHLLFKGTMFDEVTRVPLIVSGPNIKPRQTCDNLVSTIDIMPSLLEYAETDIPPSVQGTSFAPTCHGKPTNIRQSLLIESDNGSRTLWTKSARITWHGKGERGELYDHKNDPDCFNNLWNQPEAQPLQREMMEELTDLIIHNVDPLPLRTGMC